MGLGANSGTLTSDKVGLSGVGWGWVGLEGLKCAEAGTVGQSGVGWGCVGWDWAYIGGQLKHSNTSLRPARWDKVVLSGVGWGWAGQSGVEHSYV